MRAMMGCMIVCLLAGCAMLPMNQEQANVLIDKLDATASKMGATPEAVDAGVAVAQQAAEGAKTAATLIPGPVGDALGYAGWLVGLIASAVAEVNRRRKNRNAQIATVLSKAIDSEKDTQAAIPEEAARAGLPLAAMTMFHAEVKAA